MSELRYIDFINAKKSGFGLVKKLAAEGNKHIVSIPIDNYLKFFPCNSPHYLESGAKWYFCKTCVNEVNLIEDLKVERWSRNIVKKYGYQWHPGM